MSIILLSVSMPCVIVMRAVEIDFNCSMENNDETILQQYYARRLTILPSIIMPSGIMLSVILLRYIMLSVTMLSCILMHAKMLNVIMLSGIMVSLIC